MGDIPIILSCMVLGEFYTRRELFDLVKGKVAYINDFNLYIEVIINNKGVFFIDDVYGLERRRAV